MSGRGYISAYSAEQLAREHDVTKEQIERWHKAGHLNGEWSDPDFGPTSLMIPVIELPVLRGLAAGKTPQEARAEQTAILGGKERVATLQGTGRLGGPAPAPERPRRREPSPEETAEKERALFEALVKAEGACRDRGKGKGCGATIVWATSSYGRKIPIDWTPAEEPGPGQFRLEPDGRRGLRATAITKEQQDAGEVGHTSHFATCPYASHHRGKR